MTPDVHVEKVRGEIQEFYQKRATTDRYATSPDFNLRELEIEYIARHLTDGLQVLDVGCGNGYSTYSFATKVASNFHGVDFVPEMVRRAEETRSSFNLRGTVEFTIGDVTALDFEGQSFDVVVSQRCLLNLPSRSLQWTALAEIARVLRPGGRYLMLEGTLQGLARLNELRERLGLEAIPEADSATNWFSNKFDEEELQPKLRQYFSEIEHVQRFGMYYFLSRVVHPMMVAPAAPRYDAAINTVARSIANVTPDYEGLGHVALWVIRR